jgi:hypothetical protein
VDICEEIAQLKNRITALEIATGAAKNIDYYTNEDIQYLLKKWELKNIYSELTRNEQEQTDILKVAVFENKTMRTNDVKKLFFFKNSSSALNLMKKAVKKYPAELDIIKTTINKRKALILIPKR